MVSLIPEDLTKYITTISPTQEQVRGVNGGDIQLAGEAIMKVTMGPTIVHHKFLIVRQCSPTPVILGMDLVKNAQLTVLINPKQGKVSLNEPEIPLVETLDSYKVQAVNTVIVGPREHTMVWAKVDCPPQFGGYFEPAQKLRSENHLYIMLSVHFAKVVQTASFVCR